MATARAPSPRTATATGRGGSLSCDSLRTVLIGSFGEEVGRDETPLAVYFAHVEAVVVHFAVDVDYLAGLEG